MVETLARKGDIYLVKYRCGLYAVEKINKSIGMTLKASENKKEIVEFYKEYTIGGCFV